MISNSLSFIVNAVPVAQPRQRHSLVGGFVKNYTPAKHPVNSFKAAVAYAAKQAHSGPLLDSPLCVSILAVFPRPKSKERKKPSSREWKTSKPDIDNLQKSVFDALNGVLWRDDALVCCGEVKKMIGATGESASVEVVATWRFEEE